MHLDVFADGNSFFHRLDPRTKILSFLPLAFVIALSTDMETVWVGFFFSIICIFLSFLPGNLVFKRLKIINLFILFIWFTLPVSVPGKILLSIGNIPITKEGLWTALMITLKANTIVFLTITLLGTSSIFSLTHALFHLKCPKKLVYLFFFFYRYITVLHDEYDKGLRAIKLRCFAPGTNLRTFKTIGYLIGILFIKSYERSQRVYQALLLRGFRSDFPLWSHFHFRRKDFYFITGSVSLSLILYLL